jgi:hypothetical protein
MKGLIIDPYNEIAHTGRKDGISETEYVSEFLAQLRGVCTAHGDTHLVGGAPYQVAEGE